MSLSWITKYEPKKLSDIVGHQLAIKNINNWLNNFEKDSCSSILISGNHGIGKSITINLILNENGYEPLIIYPNEIKEHELLLNFMKKKELNQNIKNFMTHTKSKKFAMIIKNIEAITLSSEKTIISTLYKNNLKYKYFPLIFITNNKHSKLITDIKKISPFIIFYTPTKFEIIQFIKYICKKEKIKINKKECYKILYDFCQNDIRKLLLLLYELQYTFKSKKITKKNLLNFLYFSKKKYIDIGLFDATKKILLNYDTINNMLRLYETEKVLLPLMIHENYFKKKLSENNSIKNIISDLAYISNSISIGDNVEKSIYTDQHWYLQNIHGLYTCINTSYNLNKNMNNSNNNYNIKFSSDLNKTSLKNINKKNIMNLLKIIPHKSIEEILILNKITNNYINNNKYEELIDILSKYKNNLTLKDIELTLKIDKTSKNTLVLPIIKKKLMKILKNRNLINKN